MDIGTAKPSRADRAAVPHHLLDVATPDQIVTLAEYQRLATAAVGEIRARGRLPLLVGGAGLYIHAVVDGVAIPPVAPDWELRVRLEDEEKRAGPGTLYRRLREVDPVAASRIHPRNVRRIIRALEVHANTGTPISLLQRERGGGRSQAPDDGGAVLMVALTLDREKLYARIDVRIEQQIAQGLEQEVRALLRSGYARTLPALQGLGYAEMLAYLDGTIPFAEAVQRFRRNTRRYAKRQLTWFRADPRYVWLDVGDDSADVVAARIHAMFAV